MPSFARRRRSEAGGAWDDREFIGRNVDEALLYNILYAAIKLDVEGLVGGEALGGREVLGGGEMRSGRSTGGSSPKSSRGARARCSGRYTSGVPEAGRGVADAGYGAGRADGDFAAKRPDKVEALGSWALEQSARSTRIQR